MLRDELNVDGDPRTDDVSEDAVFAPTDASAASLDEIVGDIGLPSCSRCDDRCIDVYADMSVRLCEACEDEFDEYIRLDRLASH